VPSLLANPHEIRFKGVTFYRFLTFENPHPTPMKFLYKLFLLVFGVLLLAPSCKKDDPTPLTPPTSNNTLSPGNPSPSDADAVMYAIVQKSIQDIPFGPVELSQSIPIAVFANGSGMPTSVGSVFIEGRKMTFLSGTYTYFPGFMDTLGPLSLEGLDIEWSASGGNGFPSFTRVDSSPWPSVGAFTSSTTISKSSSYTMSVTGVANADSTIFSLGETLSVTVPGNVSSYTFNSSELSSLKLTGELMAVTAYRLGKEIVGPKKVYLGKLLTYQTPVQVIP